MTRVLRTSLVLFASAVLLACAFALVGCGSSESASKSSASSAASAASASSSQASTQYITSVEEGDPYGKGIHHAALTVEGYEPVTIELDADAAPVSVANFCKLASEGYYDGLSFYRFVEGFCMQGGTAGNNAAGNDGALTPIIGEFSQNGVQNPLADDFQKGTVAMARTSDPNSAGSTFFITLDSSQGVSQSLNGQYAAFGTIDSEDMTVIDQIVADYLPSVDDPQMGSIEDEANQAKIQSITIVD